MPADIPEWPIGITRMERDVEIRALDHKATRDGGLDKGDAFWLVDLTRPSAAIAAQYSQWLEQIPRTATPVPESFPAFIKDWDNGSNSDIVQDISPGKKSTSKKPKPEATDRATPTLQDDGDKLILDYVLDADLSAEYDEDLEHLGVDWDEAIEPSIRLLMALGMADRDELRALRDESWFRTHVASKVVMPRLDDEHEIWWEGFETVEQAKVKRKAEAEMWKTNARAEAGSSKSAGSAVVDFTGRANYQSIPDRSVPGQTSDRQYEQSSSRAASNDRILSGSSKAAASKESKSPADKTASSKDFVAAAQSDGRTSTIKKTNATQIDGDESAEMKALRRDWARAIWPALQVLKNRGFEPMILRFHEQESQFRTMTKKRIIIPRPDLDSGILRHIWWEGEETVQESRIKRTRQKDLVARIAAAGQRKRDIIETFYDDRESEWFKDGLRMEQESIRDLHDALREGMAGRWPGT
ncbi:hypothetical protein MBLNU459_g4999t1 [Dothideomycetes sp. NU459]